MKKLLLTTVISVLSLNAAHAYQAELTGGIVYAGADVPGGTDESIGAAVAGTYYFNAVQAKSGPLAEAAFIERASNVNAGYVYVQNDTSDFKVHGFNLGGEFYVPNTNFYAAADFDTAKVESIDLRGAGYQAKVGYLPITNLLLTVGANGFIDVPGNDDVNPTVSAKYLTKIGNNDVNLEGDAVFTNNGDKYTISGDYYVDRTLSLGASASTTTDQADDSYEFGINARQFVTNNISLQGGLTVGKDGSVGSPDNVGVVLAGTYRF